MAKYLPDSSKKLFPLIFRCPTLICLPFCKYSVDIVRLLLILSEEVYLLLPTLLFFISSISSMNTAYSRSLYAPSPVIDFLFHLFYFFSKFL